MLLSQKRPAHFSNVKNSCIKANCGQALSYLVLFSLYLKPLNMLNRTKTFSTSSCISMENSGLTTSTLASSQLRALVHRRSVSDSIALMRDPYFINMGNVGDDFSLEENLESYNSGDQNHHFNFSIGIYPSENNYDVRCLDPKRVKRWVGLFSVLN